MVVKKPYLLVLIQCNNLPQTSYSTICTHSYPTTFRVLERGDEALLVGWAIRISKEVKKYYSRTLKQIAINTTVQATPKVETLQIFIFEYTMTSCSKFN